LYCHTFGLLAVPGNALDRSGAFRRVGGRVFEFDLTLGPLRIRFALAAPDTTGVEYVELFTDTDVATDDYEDDTEQDRIGFRGTH
jgi:hypothetical protein